MTVPADDTMGRDIASAYLVTASRIASWVIISAVVFRTLGPQAFAILALIRATIGFLNYTSFGLAPALIHLLSQVSRTRRPVPVVAMESPASDQPVLLGYADAQAVSETRRVDETLQRLFANGLAAGFMTTAAGAVALYFYATHVDWVHDLGRVDYSVPTLAAYLGAGLLVRLLSDVGGAQIQSEGRITLDNLVLVSIEVAWVGLVGGLVAARYFFWQFSHEFLVDPLADVGLAFLVANVLGACARLLTADRRTRVPTAPLRLLDRRTIAVLLGFGALVMFGQLADFLYAPVDYNLINRLIDPDVVAIYAPAIQIDAGLLLLVGALATVLLPRTALAHAAGDVSAVRRYYLRGTVASCVILLLAAVAVWLASPWIFRLWLGEEMRPTQAILPLVLLHTVIGGSAAVGRSILLGMGRVKPYTLSVLLAGVSNVVLSFGFVYFLGMGLHGIILGTIVSVTARALLWQPWYIRRALGRAK